MKTSKKCDTSIRVLETLKILSKGSASIQDIINYFEQFDPNNRIYTNEVILKYINTLKVFGFKFTKTKDKYILLNSPNQFEFNENDLKSLYLLEKFSGLFPEEKVKSEVNYFIDDLKKRFNSNTKLLSNNITKPDFVNFELNYSKHVNRIKEYEGYCIEKQKIKIIYKKKEKSELSIIVEPIEIKYQGSEVYLSVYNALSAQIYDINFNSIVKVEQLPLKSNSTNMLSSITFELKNRLAKGYRLHEGEKLLQVKPNGSIIVLNQNEDQSILLKRLMRYGENCELISPKSVREEMKNIIQSTLNNYI